MIVYHDQYQIHFVNRFTMELLLKEVTVSAHNYVIEIFLVITLMLNELLLNSQYFKTELQVQNLFHLCNLYNWAIL